MGFIDDSYNDNISGRIKKFETIFCSGDSDQSTACINWFHNSIELYAAGYKEAGDILVESVIRDGINQDILVYPIVFLYRQYIELRLKEIIRESRILLDEGIDFPNNHHILDLWCVAKKLTIKAFEDVNELPDYNYAEHVIKEFALIDPDSISFRYPTTKGGKNTLRGVNYINIRHMATHIEGLYKELEAISSGISVFRNWQQEMLSSY